MTEWTTMDVVADVIADHPMWIGDDGQPLDYLPEREALIADFCREVAERLDGQLEPAASRQDHR